MVILRLLIAGTRTFDNYELLKEVVDDVLCDLWVNQEQFIGVEVVSGSQKGADELGERYAKEHGHTITPFPPNWNQYGKKAGPMRNMKMAEYVAEELGACIVFWDGENNGTKNMLDNANSVGIPTYMINYTLEEEKINQGGDYSDGREQGQIKREVYQ